MRIWLHAILAALVVGVSPAWSDEKGDLPKGLGINPEEVKKKLLEKFDLNGDGQVDDSEKAKVMEQMQKDLAAGKIPPEAQGLLDRNGNGKVDPEEAAMAQELIRRAQAAARGGGGPQFGAGGLGEGFSGGSGGFGGQIPPEILKKFDKNKDGELDEKEQKAAMAALGPKKSRAQQLKEKLDLNGDGKITKEEREAVAAERKAEQEEKKNKSKKKASDE